jgi:hypothetical protein
LVNTFQMFYFLFKSRFFFQNLSKFTNPLSSNVVFRSNLHHTQMDATLFSCYHRVLIQFSSLICTTYKCHILATMGCWYNFQVWFAPHTSAYNPHSCYQGCWYNFQVWFAPHTNGCNLTFLLPVEF